MLALKCRKGKEEAGEDSLSAWREMLAAEGIQVLRADNCLEADRQTMPGALREQTAEEKTMQGTIGEQNAEEKTDVQYVLYLGTNDKDTNKPVFTQAEAVEKAKDILIRHFGGYTIQEAHGGWIDDGKVYQEYTIVIYLSDTTPEKVHAAADEMIETFRQSSVLIHENPTKTEFYSGAK